MWGVISLIAFIVNPVAGGGRAYRKIPEIRRIMKKKLIDYKIFITKYAGHGKILARKAALSGFKVVVAVGGDGTVLEVVNGIKGTPAALGVIPVGTGNDFARFFHIPKKIEKAIDVLIMGNVKVIDAALINGILTFGNIASTGIASETAALAVRFKKFLSGIWAYLVALLNVLFRYKPYSVKIKMDGKEIKKDITIFAAGVLSYYAGGIKLLPGADPHDGCLDVMIVGRVNKLKILVLLPLVIFGKHVHLKSLVETYRTKKVEIEADKEIPITVDGEILYSSKIEIKVEENAIKLCTL
ncbi:YegS/Rv2252/BmrU family lipid kinase [Caldanaerobacter subterraneus]|uniref:YegS/Rv2252/BmrU family lipid kinase n=1 Tax=Caldanaerobacter subterraneus TaxID=911092 RepID=A0A4R2KCK0_9THEO|nr:diacylglycerol kinase family protein [Caldanaerobacter subterraneus]TCO64205.1 YegS/Rv2252/BmrU family lipid kinase [Caldanaerobacter subterraneus]